MKILTKSMLESKNFQRFSYPKDMDKEMIDFIDVLNNIPGCRTLYCCQGHGFGHWYFVANCCNMFPYKAIRSYFQEKQKHNSKIEIIEGCDIVSLVTCTPYGINTHRLVINGYRTDYQKKQKENIKKKWISNRETIFVLIPAVLLLFYIRYGKHYENI